MFLGISKNIGGGFRIGVGTRISSGKKGPSNKDLRTAEFSQFMKKVQLELNTAVATFVEANGHNFKQLMKGRADLDEVFVNNENYDEFISRFNKAKKSIEKVLFSGDEGIVAKRTITDEVFSLKEFLEKIYPGFSPVSAVIDDKRSVGIILGVGIIFLPYFFSWFTLRKGHTVISRVLAFSWLIILLAATVQENRQIIDQPTTKNSSITNSK